MLKSKYRGKGMKELEREAAVVGKWNMGFKIPEI